MKLVKPAVVALALLDRLAPSNEALAGDLREAFHAGRSTSWLWWQIAAAVAGGSLRHLHAPVALNLTPTDPIVAEWLASRRLRPRSVTLSSPVEGVGGLALMLLGYLLTTVVPDVWWMVIGSTAAGLTLGGVLAYRRRHRPMASDVGIHNGQLKDLFAA